MNRAVLLIEPEPALAAHLRAVLERRGDHVTIADTGRAAMAAFSECRPEVVIVDADMRDLSPLETLRVFLGQAPSLQVIFIADPSQEAMAGEAIESGATDWLSKPVSPGRLSGVLGRSERDARLRRELDHLQRRPRAGHRAERLVAVSATMRMVCDRIARLAADPARADRDVPPLLISGESGTGKRAVARALHREGPRRSRPLIVVDCADPSAEVELFGIDSCAHGPAPQIGLVEAARGGTLVLRRIDDASPTLQERLVELIDQGRYRRQGASRPSDADVQLIATSRGRPTGTGYRETLRPDVFQRLAGEHLRITPLRDRVDDIAPLAQRFAFEAGARDPAAVGASAAAALRAHSWPGNARELRQVIDHAIVLARGATIEPEHLSLASFEAAGFGDRSPIDALPTEGMTLADIERQLLLKALRSSRWNVSKAARDLGLSRDTMRYRIEKFQLKMAE